MATVASGSQQRDGALDAALAHAEAQRTVPRDAPNKRLRLGAPVGQPAIDPELWELHVRYHRFRDRRDREQLVEHYRSLASTLARRYYREREPFDDLLQVALEALLLALDRFDPSRGIPFIGFARPTIVGCLKRHYRDNGWALRVPRRVHTLSGPVRHARSLLLQDLGREPTVSEIADLLEIKPGEVDEVITAITARAMPSLDVGPDEDGAIRIGAPDQELARAEDRLALRHSIEQLEPDDQELLHLYYDQGLRQTEIAELRGCSQMHVSRSLRRIVVRLRQHMDVTA